MAYDTELAERVRAALHRATAKTAPHRRMCCGVAGADLVIRVGPARYRAALAEPHARPMDFTGRPLEDFVYVAPAGCRRPADLAKWVRRGVSFVGTLPPKT